MSVTRGATYVFDDTQVDDFASHLLGQLDIPIPKLAESEVAHLGEVFSAAAKALAPYDLTGEITPGWLTETYRMVASGFNSLMRNRPVICSPLRADNKQPWRDTALDQKIKSLTEAKVFTRYTQPAPSPKFGRYGLITLQAQTSDHPKPTVLSSYVEIPQAFIGAVREAGTPELLDELAVISELCGHDYLHQLLLASITDKIRLWNEKETGLKSSWSSEIFNDYVAPCVKHDHIAYEYWSMRTHVETMVYYLADPENDLMKAVHRYLDAWERFEASDHAQIPVGKKNRPAADYAAGLLGYTLYRVMDRGYPQHQEIRQRLGSYTQTYDAAFPVKLDRFLYDRGTRESPQQYTDQMMRTTVKALRLARQDCEPAPLAA